MNTPRHTWRVRGVPQHFDEKLLAAALRSSPNLSSSDDFEDPNHVHGDYTPKIHTLAADLRSTEKVATIRFHSPSVQLGKLKRTSQQSFKIELPSETPQMSASLTIDQHFDGITTLFCPPTEKHQVDILAIPGLGSHPFGSFVHKEDGHMWLAESLPRDLPTARVMIYGYRSGLQNSSSFANLDDLASSLQIAIARLLQSGREKKLILIGHSLGGLLIKEALIRMAKPSVGHGLMRYIYGCVFFGVPNDGMDIESLIPMVTDQPNRFLLESLNAMNSQISRLQRPSFSKLLDENRLELFCFYETRLSRTAAKNPDTGEYKMEGPFRCLVNVTSATSCLPCSAYSEYSAAIDRAHSDLVKFSAHDSEYDNISYLISDMCKKCVDLEQHERNGQENSSGHIRITNRLQGIPNTIAGTTVTAENVSTARKAHKVGLLPKDPDFVPRPNIWNRLIEEYAGSSRRMALVGFGGVGKTQMAIQFAHHVHDSSPDGSVFWVHGSTQASFKESYQCLADRLELPRRDEPGVNVLALVRDWLQRDEVASWLMVLDNADTTAVFFGNTGQDNSQTPIASYLPKSGNGRILVTSRYMTTADKLTGSPKRVIEMPTMKQPEALQLFKNKIRQGVDEDGAAELVQALDFVPLAVSQAAAFISREAPRVSVRSYIDDFHRSEKKKDSLLHSDLGDLWRQEDVSNSVVVTWQVTFEQIRNERPTAANLLSLMSMFQPQNIPESLLHGYSNKLPNSDSTNRDKPNASGSDDFDEDFRILRGYSLINLTTTVGLCDMHSLVQFCTRAWLTKCDELRRWEKLYLSLLSNSFPDGSYETWSACQILLPHIQRVIDEKPSEESQIIEWSELLTNVSWYMSQMGEYSIAEKFAEAVVEERKKVLGETNNDTLRSMADLASTYRNQSQWEEAKKLDVQVMETCKSKFGVAHLDTLSSIQLLASTYHSQGLWEEAEKLVVQVVETCKDKLGLDHPDTLISMDNLASIYYSQGRWEEAEKLEVQAMKIRKNKLGLDHPDTLISMDNLASIYYSQGRWEEAEKLEVQAMKIRKNKLGLDHPNTLFSLGNLASIYHSQGRWEEAEKLEVQVMETRKTKLGADHPNTLTSMGNLAFTLKRLGRLSEAVELMRVCTQLRKRRLGPTHLDTKVLERLAKWEQELG